MLQSTSKFRCCSPRPSSVECASGPSLGCAELVAGCCFVGSHHVDTIIILMVCWCAVPVLVMFLQKRVDAGVAMFQESKRLKEELDSISTRVFQAVQGYEACDTQHVLGDTSMLQQSKQELLDTFNFRLARSRAQSSTLKCTCIAAPAVAAHVLVRLGGRSVQLTTSLLLVVHLVSSGVDVFTAVQGGGGRQVLAGPQCQRRDAARKGEGAAPRHSVIGERERPQAGEYFSDVYDGVAAVRGPRRVTVNRQSPTGWTAGGRGFAPTRVWCVTGCGCDWHMSTHTHMHTHAHAHTHTHTHTQPFRHALVDANALADACVHRWLISVSLHVGGVATLQRRC
jgi:hypothetical protein